MNKSVTILILAMIFLLLLVTVVIAAPEEFSLDWWTVDGGGGTSQGGGFRLHGTIGQPDAGYLLGENYQLGGGFFGGAEVALSYEIYLPLTQR